MLREEAAEVLGHRLGPLHAGEVAGLRDHCEGRTFDEAGEPAHDLGWRRPIRLADEAERRDGNPACLRRKVRIADGGTAARITLRGRAGQHVAPAAELGRPLTVECYVNGVRRQSSNTKELIFPVDHLIWFISSVMTLLPGDIIATGTPSGIGPVVPGDVVTIAVEGVGELTNPVEALADGS